MDGKRRSGVRDCKAVHGVIVSEREKQKQKGRKTNISEIKKK